MSDRLFFGLGTKMQPGRRNAMRQDCRIGGESRLLRDEVAVSKPLENHRGFFGGEF